ncbi:F-box/FBD/LRR-repeat protein At1g13570 [Linum grandiflorum]
MASSIASADRISRLPDDVRMKILMLLPLREAVKSSVLSSIWRNLWTILPTLIIDKSISESQVLDRVMLNIYRVLSLHCGPLKGLCLCHSILSYEANILRILPYQNLECLVIQTGREVWKLSKQVFSSFSQLKKLHLSSCEFTFSPISFERFDRLIDFQLHNGSFQNDLAQLIFNCALLRTLTLTCFGTRPRIPIIVIEEARNLRNLRCVGLFESLSLQHTPRLKDVFIDKYSTYPIVQGFGPALLGTNGGLAAVECLSVSGHFYEYLAAGVIPNLCNINEPWKKLRRLRLDEVWSGTDSHVWSVVCMIIASPNLQQLSIQMYNISCSVMKDFKGYDMQRGDVTASESDTRRMLTRVVVKGVSGTRNEMALIKWLLNISPMLEEMKIQLYTKLSDAEKLSIMARLNGFRKASNRAQITLE